MADTWSEYVDLLSTASLDLYPENVGSFFTNKLVVPQQLPDNTYVALEEIGYINTFYNVKKTFSSLTIFDMFEEFPANTPPINENPYPIYGAYKTCPLKEGLYGSMSELCDMLNDAIRNSGCSQVKDKTIFTFDPVTMKFSYNLEGLWLSLWIRGDLLNMLGIEHSKATYVQYVILGKSKTGPTYEIPESEIPKKPEELKPLMEYSGQHRAEKLVTRHFRNPHIQWQADSQDMKNEFEFVAQLTLVNSFVVYIDCIDSQVTGDSFSDALRIIAIKGDDKPGSSIVTHFTKPYFLRVNKRYIPTITIKIQDLAGYPIDFKQGVVRIKLQFTTQPPP